MFLRNFCQEAKGRNRAHALVEMRAAHQDESLTGQGLTSPTGLPAPICPAQNHLTGYSEIPGPHPAHGLPTPSLIGQFPKSQPSPAALLPSSLRPSYQPGGAVRGPTAPCSVPALSLPLRVGIPTPQLWHAAASS